MDEYVKRINIVLENYNITYVYDYTSNNKSIEKHKRKLEKLPRVKCSN